MVQNKWSLFICMFSKSLLCVSLTERHWLHLQALFACYHGWNLHAVSFQGRLLYDECVKFKKVSESLSLTLVHRFFSLVIKCHRCERNLSSWNDTWMPCLSLNVILILYSIFSSAAALYFFTLVIYLPVYTNGLFLLLCFQYPRQGKASCALGIQQGI